MSNPASSRRLPEILAFLLGTFFVVASCGILASHAQLFSVKRDTAIMIGTQLPELKSTVALLEASVEAERIFAERALASREEQSAAYVLPKDSPVSRVVSTVQEVVLSVKGDGPLTLQSIKFDSKTVDKGSLKTVAGTILLRGRLSDVGRVLSVLGYGGVMMVRDVLSVEDQQTFLRSIESVAPLTLKSAQDFLYLDLVEYAADPERAEQRLATDAPTDAILAIRTSLLESGLAGVRSTLGPVASVLRSRDLWPLTLLRIDSVARDGDLWTIRVTALSR